MAITTKRVYLSGSVLETFAPSGHTCETTAASIGTVSIKEKLTLEITASDVVNSTKATAMDTLIKTELVTAIDAAVTATGSNGFGINTTANTVQYNGKVLEITRGTNGLANDTLLPAANDDFRVTVELSIALS